MSESRVQIVSLMERIERGDILISDGATGTYLQSHGLEPGGCPEEFNVSNPHVVKKMASDYFSAGSDMVLTNSFGANKFMLGKYGFADSVTEFNRLAAEHARSVAPQGHYVIGSVGPTGEFVAPLGEISEKTMLDAFSKQIIALADGGVDGINIETMTALDEAKLAIKAAKFNTDLPVMTTITVDKGPRGFFTMMGVTPKNAVHELQRAGADVVGSNCGNGIDVMIEVALEMRQESEKPLLIHSNAGIPVIRKGQIIYPETPAYMAKRFKILADMGINIIGGCCGTTPAHITALRKSLKKYPTTKNTPKGE